MKKENGEIKVVVFDMAGTTIDEKSIVYRSVQKALQLHGFSFDLQDVMLKIGGMSKKEGIDLLMGLHPERYSGALVEEVFQDFLSLVEEQYRANKEIEEKEGASDLFRFLHERNVKVALDTGYARRTFNILLEKMKWSEFSLIDYSVTSDEVEKGRPEPFMIEKIAHYFDCSAQEIMKVGDTQSDLDEGHNAGCSVVVGISSSRHDKAQLLQMGATHAVDKLEEIKEMFG